MSLKANNNPTGINQHKLCSKKGNKHLAELLWMALSQATVSWCCDDLRLHRSGKTTCKMLETNKCQLVLDQMSQDPTGCREPVLTREAIIFYTGTMIDEMHLHHPEGFALCEPSAKKVKCGILTSLGPHHGWSADDKWSGKWLGLWVLPNNRYQASIAYLYLSLVAELEALEVVKIGPAHRFLKSVYNITIEQGWLQLCLHWGGNVCLYGDAGQDVYDASIPNHYLPSGVSPNVTFALFHKYDAINCLQLVDVAVVHNLMEEIGGEELIQFAAFNTLQITSLTFNNVQIVLKELLCLMQQ
ncbi:hypothetical protein L208DRAFT_1420399 [Tricholoma matsutake]|nr:hypothetical protein L208DRAFT_1420399 [Tricholoma matsutake 945]